MVGTRPQFLIKNQDFKFEATFLEFQSLDWSHIAYYASIKWVEAFTKDHRSKHFFKGIKKYIIGIFFGQNRDFLISK